MPLLTIVNLTTSPITFQDPTGLYGTSLLVAGSATLSNQSIELPALAALEPLLAAEATASNITWTVANDPTTGLDPIPDHITTVLVTPYDATVGDQIILTNLTSPGAVSVVLAAGAPIGQRVQVVDLKGDGASNNITITAAGGGTISGGANLVINTNKGSAWLEKVGSTSWVGFTTSVISSGAAGGDLTGTYPNPSLAATFVSAPQALSGAGAINVTARTTLFTSTGAAQALTLANGTRTGQRKTVLMTVDGGSGVITPATAGNFATATLTAVKDWVEFEWSGAAWNVVGFGGTTSFT